MQAGGRGEFKGGELDALHIVLVPFLGQLG
jgi:hypothetical protein